MALPVDPTVPIGSATSTAWPAYTDTSVWWQYQTSVPSGSVTIVRSP